MLRALLYGLAILHLGPGIAFAALAFGCDPVHPMLGGVCSKGTLAAFVELTGVLWVLLVIGALGWTAWRRRIAKT